MNVAKTHKEEKKVMHHFKLPKEDQVLIENSWQQPNECGDVVERMKKKT